MKLNFYMHTVIVSKPGTHAYIQAKKFRSHAACMHGLSTKYFISHAAMNYTLNISTCCEVEREFDEGVIFIQQYGETTSIHSSAALGYISIAAGC